MKEVQMIYSNFDIKNNRNVKDKYPTLYEEVLLHDTISHSSWYRLTDEAYGEWDKYCSDKSIGFLR